MRDMKILASVAELTAAKEKPNAFLLALWNKE